MAMAAAFGRSLLSWYVDGGSRPFSASFAITNRCNLRCSYCNTPFLDPTDLPLGRIEVIFDRLAAFGVKRVGLSGGEPMVRKDLGEIVRSAKSRGFRVTLNSNLLLLGRHREQVREVDPFFTSLDGDREAHEAARGKGAYDGVLESIGELVAERRPVVAICVVTEHSIDQADHLLDVAERVGFRIHFQPRCTDTTIVRGSIPAGLANERQRAFWARLRVLKTQGRPVASSDPYLEVLSDWADFNISSIADPAARCSASRGFLYIDPQGLAYPCAYTKGKTPAVDLLGDDWKSAVGRETPCSRCSVGPHLEFNLLYDKPIRTGLSLLRSYL
jgi:MoaA/NifB/PqqE/SkfB family radical SAM enzyme